MTFRLVSEANCPRCGSQSGGSSKRRFAARDGDRELFSWVGHLVTSDGSPRRPLTGPSYERACWHHVCTVLDVDFVVDPESLIDPGWIREQPCPVLSFADTRAVVALLERTSFSPVTPAGRVPTTRSTAWSNAARAALPALCDLDARVPVAITGWTHKQRPLLGVFQRFEYLLAERDTLLACTLAGTRHGDDEALRQRSWDALVTQGTAALDTMAGALTEPAAPLAAARPKNGFPPKLQSKNLADAVGAVSPDFVAEFERIKQMATALATLRNQIHEGPLIHVHNLNQGPTEVALSKEMAGAIRANLGPHIVNLTLRDEIPTLDVWNYTELLVASVRFVIERVATWWGSLDAHDPRWPPFADADWLRDFPIPRLVPAHADPS